MMVDEGRPSGALGADPDSGFRVKCSGLRIEG
jgi:hypothetical protein